MQSPLIIYYFSSCRRRFVYSQPSRPKITNTVSVWSFWVWSTGKRISSPCKKTSLIKWKIMMSIFLRIIFGVFVLWCSFSIFFFKKLVYDLFLHSKPSSPLILCAPFHPLLLREVKASPGKSIMTVLFLHWGRTRSPPCLGWARNL